MPVSQDYESIVGFATAIVALAGVVVIGKTVTGAMSHNSIPPEDLRRIADKYGWWAARRAEATVPHMDVEACEREAKKLYEVMKYRR